MPPTSEHLAFVTLATSKCARFCCRRTQQTRNLPGFSGKAIFWVRDYFYRNDAKEGLYRLKFTLGPNSFPFTDANAKHVSQTGTISATFEFVRG